MKSYTKRLLKGTFILGAAMSLSACNGLFENIYDQAAEAETEITDNGFSMLDATSYTDWIYINLSEHTATTVPIGDDYEDQIPAEWDFAIHRYDIKTNGGAGYQTNFTSLDEAASSTLPADEDFTEDEWTTNKIAIDMSGMMDGNILYAESYRNSVLSSWLNVDTSSMPPIYTMSTHVYLLRLKDQTHAAIQFTNYTNAKGVKGYISFDFLYPLEQQ